MDRCVWIYLQGSHFRGFKVGLVGLVEPVLCVEVGLHLCSNCLEMSEELFKRWPLGLVINKHHLRQFCPLRMQLFRVLHFSFEPPEFLEFSLQRHFGLDMFKELSTRQHFIQYQPNTPHITLLIIIFHVEHLWRGKQRRPCSFCHQNLNIPGQPKICNLQLQIIIK